MNELLQLLLALSAGIALGAFFFGALWWTVGRGLASRSPALWFFTSLILRLGIAMAGIYLVGRTSWQRLLICAFGFAIARLMVVRRATGSSPPPRVTRAS